MSSMANTHANTAYSNQRATSIASAPLTAGYYRRYSKGLCFCIIFEVRSHLRLAVQHSQQLLVLPPSYPQIVNISISVSRLNELSFIANYSLESPQNVYSPLYCYLTIVHSLAHFLVPSSPLSLSAFSLFSQQFRLFHNWHQACPLPKITQRN